MKPKIRLTIFAAVLAIAFASSAHALTYSISAFTTQISAPVGVDINDAFDDTQKIELSSDADGLVSRGRLRSFTAGRSGQFVGDAFSLSLGAADEVTITSTDTFNNWQASLNFVDNSGTALAAGNFLEFWNDLNTNGLANWDVAQLIVSDTDGIHDDFVYDLELYRTRSYVSDSGSTFSMMALGLFAVGFIRRRQ